MAEEAIILLYHGVTDAPSRGIENFAKKHLPADEFEAQMAFLAQHTQVLSLRELATRISKGDPLPPNSVAVTFDDSYKNNATVALPILEHYVIPATFFIATGYISTKRRYWTDKLEHLINLTGSPEMTLHAGGGGMAQTLKMGTVSERIAAVVQIKAHLKRLPPNERYALLDEVKQASGVQDVGDDVENYANMTWADVRALDASPLCEVGGHTVNHEIMAYLEIDALRHEIVECKAMLKDQLGHDIDLYSYPEGQREHYNDTVIAELKRAGIHICPAATHGSNPVGADPFTLNRIMVGFMGQQFPFPNFA